MASMVSWRLVLCLSVLLAVFLAHSGEGARSYRNFANSHIDSPKTKTPNSDAYCNLMMQRRGLTRGRCKPVNAFINNKPSDIQRICRRGGTHAGSNLYDSKRRFRTVLCRNRGRFPNCRYVGKKEVRRIRVACNKNNMPFHLDAHRPP